MTSFWVTLAERLGWIPQRHVQIHEQTQRELEERLREDAEQNARLDAIERALNARAALHRRQDVS